MKEYKNKNMIRNMKNVRKYVIVSSNDEVRIRRLALIYDDCIETCYSCPEKIRVRKPWFNEKPDFKYEVVLRLTVEERDKMVKNIGLVRQDSEYGSNRKRNWTWKDEQIKY